jgi:simple sugar transport system permease protein
LGLTTIDKEVTNDKRERLRFLGNSPLVPPLITLAAGLILFSLFVPHFATVRTVSGFLSSASINAIVVIGVTLLMIAGEFDLSVGAIMAMGGLIFARIMLDGGSPIVAFGLALLVAGALGAINGLLTIWSGIPSFIVTLGTRSIYRAAVWLLSGGLMLQTTQKLPVYNFFNGRLDIVNQFFTRANFRTVTVWAVLLGLLVHFLLTRTAFGNHVFAIGGNPGAAVSQGVKTKRVKVICFTITGILSGLAGVMTFSQFFTVFVATGSGLELTSIASAVAGGTVLTGGVGSIIGGLLGILLINMLRTGVVLLGLPSDNFEAIVGVAIIGAAVLNERLRGRL